MLSWHVDRIDFVKEARCHFCKRALTSNVALILVDINGRVAQAGPSCARKNAPKPANGVPNFTKASFDVLGEEAEDAFGNVTKTPSDAGTPTVSSKPCTSVTSIEYLRLRIEMLVEFPTAKTIKLEEIYSRFQNELLNSNDLHYLDNLIQKMERERPELSPNNLQACYAYSFWIRRFLKDEESNFVESLLGALQRNFRLSEAQIVALNKWFANRHGLPKLNPNAFAKQSA